MSESIDPRLAAALAHNEQMGGTRAISYGGMQIFAPLRDIQEAIELLNNGNRLKIMASVNTTLARTFPRVKKGTASTKTAIKCGQDIAIWFANEVIEGRGSLEIN